MNKICTNILSLLAVGLIFTSCQSDNDDSGPKKDIVSFEIKNEFGRMVIFIPVEKSNYHNSVTQIETYTWSIYQSGLVGVTDDLFSIIFSSTQAWAECLNELLM